MELFTDGPRPLALASALEDLAMTAGEAGATEQSFEALDRALVVYAEAGVARLVAHGLTNREVAEQLFVSPHTVSSHLRQVFAKLDVNSRVELTRLAVEREPRP